MAVLVKPTQLGMCREREISLAVLAATTLSEAMQMIGIVFIDVTPHSTTTPSPHLPYW